MWFRLPLPAPSIMVFRLTTENKKVLTAYKYGYRVLVDGTLMSPNLSVPMSPYLSSKGYYRCPVRFEGKKTSIDVHRLQAYQKYGHKIFHKNIHVRHLNGNPLDNSINNIAIGTPQDNSLDRPPEDRLAQAKKAAKVLRKLSDEQLVEFRADRENGFTYSQLMKKYGLAKSTVSYIVNCKTYT